ncbi:MAG: hypothetical protein GEV09_23920 [Pseudonocardiaceae bacterium]|nr:hypothetical protein [Pseudonocardiaceae bacterium]
MHGSTGGDWKRSVDHGRSESCSGETPSRSAETYRRSTPPRQSPTLHHHRLVRSRPRRGPGGLVYLARWPSHQAAQHARDRIRFLTMRARLAAPVEQVVAEVNTFLRGWAGYFRYGNSAHAFDKISSYARMRLALFVAKRHKHGRSWGFAQVYRSGDDLGLISLNGTVVAPRPNRPWRAPAEHRR